MNEFELTTLFDLFTNNKGYSDCLQEIIEQVVLPDQTLITMMSK